jgi:hypothetical protein
MKKSIALFWILLLSLSVFCQENDGQILRLKFDFLKVGQVKMSEVFSDITYIPLETNQNSLIGYMNIPVYGKEIIIRAYYGNSSDIFRFSRDGKFLNKIGSVGRGPEEYLDNTDVVLYGDTVLVVSNFLNEVICYSLSGRFLKKYHINSNGRPKSIVRLQDKSFMISLANPSDNGILLKTDKDLKIITGFIKEVPFKNNPLDYNFQRSGDKVYFYYNYFDTIYDVSKGYPKPSIIVDYGEFKVSKRELSDDKKANVILNKPSISDFNSNDHYLRLNAYYPFTRTTSTLLYRISDGKQIIWSELVNDIDSGATNRWSGLLHEESLIYWIMPSAIIERLEKMTPAEKADPKNSAFVKMAEKITLESNPVIMICKLK